MSHEAILEIPNVVVVSGPAGQSFLVVQASADLAADVGRDGDRAIIRATGAEWLKTAGVWASTGGNFWGTLLAQAAGQVDLARRWAEEDPDVEVDGGFSALHWAGRAALIAAMFGDLQSAMTAINEAASAAASSAATSGTNAGLTAADVVATAASAAQAAAAVGGVIYDTTAAGIAATTNGQFFIVKGDGTSTYALMYKNVAAVATLISRFPDKLLLDQIAETANFGDNAGIPALLQIADYIMGYVEESGQIRFLFPLDPDDLPATAGTLDIAENVADPGENFGADGLIMYGDRVAGAVDKFTGQIRPMVPFHPDDIPFAASSEASSAYADGSNYLVSPNEMWSQWIVPRTIENDAGDQYWGSISKQEGPFVANGTGLVGRPSKLHIGHREGGGAAKKHLIGYSEENTGSFAARGSGDDHNSPANLLHPNPLAPVKLVVGQFDHNAKQQGRFWSATTYDPADLVLLGKTPVFGSEFPAYCQLFWNRTSPNELRGAYRTGGFSTGIWSFFVGDPATAPSTWTYHRNKIGGDGGYFRAVPALDNSGMWLCAHRHPTQPGAKKITLTKLKWDWSLVSATDVVISADIRAEVTPIDILDNPDVTTIDVATGSRMFRMFDGREYADGKMRFAYGDFPALGKATFAGDYKVAAYDFATDTIEIDTVCQCGGMIQEEVSLNGEYVAGSGSSSYLAGVCLTDRPDEIIACRWWGPDVGGDLVHCVRNALNDWIATTLDRSAGKLFRPEGHARQSWEGGTFAEQLTSRFSYLRGSGARGGYAMFYNFNADRITVDLANFRSEFV